jgi:hypothetical protein
MESASGSRYVHNYSAQLPWQMVQERSLGLSLLRLVERATQGPHLPCGPADRYELPNWRHL